MTKPTTFEEFWPLYLNAHRDRRTRLMHVLGTGAALAAAVLFLVTGHFGWAIAAPLLAYGLAWLSHALFETNTPMTFSHPVWSVRGDVKMVRLALMGRLDAEARRFEPHNVESDDGR